MPPFLSHDDDSVKEGLLETSSFDTLPRYPQVYQDFPDTNFHPTEPESHTRLRRAYRRAIWTIWALAFTCLCTLLLLLFLYIQLSQRGLHCRSLDLFPSLAEDPKVVQFEKKKLPVKLSHNPFVGDPSPELDNAWHGLFDRVNIRVSAKDLQYAEVDSLKLADGSGDYIGLLGMHHELHCLKKIRHWIYKDFYYPNLTVGSEAYVENKVHVDHCIENIRVSTMCRADTSLNTFAWMDVSKGWVTAAEDTGYHSCANMDNLMGWVKERSLDLLEPNLLLQPGEN
ncbi:hypothetical protein P152DRAFT_455666 [Eremomyces bilateralis CBS 781.70]|uniref:Tat pathway signal sequence n=1 Tax=Eremomyces bilateralis CBS 781.70 TaxID=1392243 RepID=A0A6G1GDJ3_9PEZI|nr:uncharacterized protein P152DRAFT_455666 [Eremomyces bilateralis CBS 781.70]KAF1815939.1 hypothetical protein P152DRAFT_455666 [Eremomyces bilateralis CBS 781.70]